MITLRHKPSECIGCDLCAETAPEYFEMDEFGMAQLISIERSSKVFNYTTAPDMDLDVLQEAEEGCPVNIIAVNPKG